MSQAHAVNVSMSTAHAAPARGGSGFFKHHGVWAPGVRLFRVLGFQAKAVIIALSFVIPLTLLSWNYFNTQHSAISFAEKERLGVVYARETAPLLKALQDQRLYSTQEAAKGVAPPLLAPARETVKVMMARLAAVQALHGAELGTAKAYNTLLARAQALPPASAGIDAVFAAHSAQVQALLALVTQVADGSNLTLDPEVDSYYLMDAAIFRLPVMQESVAQVRGLGAGMLTAGQAKPAQIRRLIEQNAVLANNQTAVEVGLAKAAAHNPSVQDAVKPAAATAVVRGFLSQVDNTVLNADGLQGTPAAHVAAGNQAVSAMVALGSSATSELDELLHARTARLQFSRNLAGGVLLLGLLTAAYLFAVFHQVLSGGMRELAHHINAMRDGDLSTRPHAWGRDEAAQLLNAVAQMQASFQRIVAQVRITSDGIVTASTQITVGAEDLAARTETSAMNLEKTAAAMEQIASTVKNNQNAVEQAAALAGGNAEVAERGGQIVGQVAQTMQGINQSSHKISEIIGTIDSIAFQTNILALNAAVEAARAGEQGRGFAVVATEVRALAQRSAAAAREIKTLITQSVDQVAAGTRVVTQAGATMQDIVGTSQKVRSLLAEIAVGAREQSVGVAQSATAVQEMDSATQQNATLVEETAAAAAALQAQAQGLVGEVAQFKLPVA
jgi:methyl-accepting chemotaxis protein